MGARIFMERRCHSTRDKSELQLVAPDIGCGSHQYCACSSEIFQNRKVLEMGNVVIFRK